MDLGYLEVPKSNEMLKNPQMVASQSDTEVKLKGFPMVKTETTWETK